MELKTKNKKILQFFNEHKLDFEDKNAKSKIMFKELVYRRNSDSSIHLESAYFYFFK